ncbi:Cd(II)/Pb(II)-responsive transcriptional regulator [Chitinimonas naiadis]
MKIGELAQVAQCTVETIRYYEKEGLLSEPERTAANYRSYGELHVERLRFIRNCRALDMTHGEIRALLGLMDKPDDGCGAINHLLDDHIGHVDARIAELLQLKQQLTLLRQQCQTERTTDACGILHGLATMETETKAERHTHLG